MKYFQITSFWMVVCENISRYGRKFPGATL